MDKIDDFRIELQALLKRFTDGRDISEQECYTMSLTIVNIMTSDLETRMNFYGRMSQFAKECAKECRQKFDMILASLDMTDEEKEELKKRVKAIVDGGDKDKIEN